MTDINKNSTKALADKYIFQTYGRFPVVLTKGKGCRVWDEEGREYIDFVGGIAVCALGHSSPLITRVLDEQSRILVHVSNLYYTRPQAELARLLVENSFADRVFFCNSGAEANEAAIKIARRYSNEKYDNKRNNIISMKGSFHGRTMATLSATGQEKVKTGYNPLVQGFKFVPFNDLSSLEKAVDETVCAVMLEPIQCEGGIICPDEGYLKGVRDICDKNGLVLIFDEVQTGMGRTGRLFAYEHFGIKPDVMTLAKALGNGFPIGAMLATEDLSSAFTKGAHATTFGGTPLATAVAKAVTESIINDGLIDNSRDMGDYFKGRLGELKEKYSVIRQIRGMGLVIGLEMEIEGTPIVNACIEKGFLVNCVQEKVIRLVPPLIIGRKEIDLFIDAFNDILRTI
ncbi:MAG: acetylornithine transaminase [Deltaproteobacteria bacterium]|nr:acetylornithine transaminase [Deltaproteobacteria bacterium]